VSRLQVVTLVLATRPLILGFDWLVQTEAIKQMPKTDRKPWVSDNGMKKNHYSLREG